MDVLAALFQQLKSQGLAKGHFLGFLHVLIGRKISLADGTPVSNGISWRALAEWLKKIRWDPEDVRELGIDPETLPPRDRFRYWNLSISQAKVDSSDAIAAGEAFAEKLRQLGYQVGPPPHKS